jgi:hypothetical protein
MGISVSCIDTLNYDVTIRALKTTIETLQGKVTKVYWFSDIKFPEKIDIPVKWIPINKFVRYTDEYNYVTLKLMPSVIEESHNLTIHGDGFAVNSDAWTDVFLQYDYIGAVWPMYADKRVGNGGFTLRSKKLYDTLARINVKYRTEEFLGETDLTLFNTDNKGDRIVPEDNIICRYYRTRLEDEFGIEFAPVPIADRFSIELNTDSLWLGKSLGFHNKRIAHHYGVEL